MSQKNTAPTPLTTEKKLLNTIEAAALLGLKPGTLEIWRWNGRGPRFIKLGRSCRYHVDDLTAFVDAGIRNSTSEA